LRLWGFSWAYFSVVGYLFRCVSVMGVVVVEGGFLIGVVWGFGIAVCIFGIGFWYRFFVFFLIWSLRFSFIGWCFCCFGIFLLCVC